MANNKTTMVGNCNKNDENNNNNIGWVLSTMLSAIDKQQWLCVCLLVFDVYGLSSYVKLFAVNCHCSLLIVAGCC